jgi:hypothetical protein
MAQMRSADLVWKRLLFEVDRTYDGHHQTDAIDPWRTSQNRLLDHLVGAVTDGLRVGQPTVKRLELNADFFAGYFAGMRKRERATFSLRYRLEPVAQAERWAIGGKVAPVATIRCHRVARHGPSLEVLALN